MSFLDKIKDKAKDFSLTEIGNEVKDKLKQGYGGLTKVGEKVSKKVGLQGPFKELEKDTKLARTLHADVIAAINTLQEKHDINDMLEKAYGYAVVPAMGRASLVLGGAYGVGEVFENNRVIGYASIIKVDIGIQVGGTNFHEMIVFNDKEAWKQFKKGKYAFSADAGVAIVKAGAQASRGFGANTVVFVYNEGGMLLDLSIGVQKFIFKKAALGTTRTAGAAGHRGPSRG